MSTVPFPVLQGGQHKALHKILLTASGGPFRGKKREELLNIQVEDALKHPNWEMGRKITIDSSTMVNKGLEVIEAKMAVLMCLWIRSRLSCSHRVSFIPWLNMWTAR